MRAPRCMATSIDHRLVGGTVWPGQAGPRPRRDLGRPARPQLGGLRRSPPPRRVARRSLFVSSGEGALTMTANIRWIAMLAAGASLAACGGGGDDAPPDGGAGTPVLARPSKSSTVAITGNDRFVAMVNPETDSISVF